MLARIVSISWPHDPPASASQSAGITGISHHTLPINSFLREFFFLVGGRQSLTLLLRLECRGIISAYHNFYFLGSSCSPVLVSWVAGITGMCHLTQLIFIYFLYFLVEMGFHYVGQAGIELLTSGDSPSLVSLRLQEWATVPSLFKGILALKDLIWLSTQLFLGPGSFL